MKKLLNYFFRGMLVVLPVGITFYLLVLAFTWVNRLFNRLFLGWINYDVPGMGILVGFIAITILGFIFSRAFTRPIVYWFEKLMGKTPIVSIVYSSLKDLTEALVGEKKKFTEPVMVDFGVSGVKRFGFITQESMQMLGLDSKIAVYCPHSYNFSGNLYVVDPKSIEPIKADSTDFMRFIVSGGITGFGN